MSAKRRKKRYTNLKKNFDYGSFICPKCGLEIKEITQALNDRETNKPMHFDCAKQAILEAETIPENAVLSYLGNGTFGIVQFEDTNPRNRKNFKIIKKITFETAEAGAEWRDKLKETFEKNIQA